MRSRLRDIQAGGLLKTGEDTMKKKIHPDNYREVVFQDFNADFSFLTRSAVKTTETIQWEDGKEYPLFKLDISSASHPFYRQADLRRYRWTRREVQAALCLGKG